MQPSYMIRYQFDTSAGDISTDEENILIGFSTQEKHGILMFIRSDANPYEYISIELNNNGLCSSLCCDYCISSMSFCNILPVELASFFIPSTSFCSFSSWFTSSCTYHLITVTIFARIIYHSLGLSVQT